MMINPMRQELDRVYREEMMRKAEDIRRAQALQSTNGTSRTTVLLARVGKALSTVGNLLPARGSSQERSDTRAKAPVRQPDGDRSFVNMARSH